MITVAKKIQELYNTGAIHEGIAMAKRHIREYGESEGESPYVIYLLAKGLFAIGFYYEAHYWVNRTLADPENTIPLRERIERHCGV